MDAAQVGNDRHLSVTCLRRLEQEPTYEGDPKTIKSGAPEESHHAEQNEAKCDGLTHTRRRHRRAVGVAAASPENRPQDPATVQREARNQVEDSQRDVDVPQPAQHRRRWADVGLWRPTQ